KLMCWLALDRAATLADMRGDPQLATEWNDTAEEIRAEILDRGLDARGVLRQHYDTDALDASTLLAAIFAFLPGNDERLHRSVLAVADELCAAAELVMGKLRGVPAAVVRGYAYEPGEGSARELLRAPETDMFR
ncbi:MAG TPA: glycoside hydrolase family 15 protein, partial [Chloroflexota bacterium]|nr:glycoside hydrolase family 15 protein [Chloroflexota bacterium]